MDDHKALLVKYVGLIDEALKTFSLKVEMSGYVALPILALIIYALFGAFGTLLAILIVAGFIYFRLADVKVEQPGND